MRRLLPVAMLLGLAGCAATASPSDAAMVDAAIDPACGGARPTLDACTRGVFDADCGGTGSPVLACSDTSARCMWFAHGCVAQGFVASDCAAGNICCHGSGADAWAFASDWAPSGTAVYAAQTVEDVRLLGGAVVTRTTPAPITVTIDPSVTAPTAASITCDPALTWNVCSDSTNVFASALVPNGGTVIRAQSISVVPFQLTLELVQPTPGTYAARAFLVQLQDAEGTLPPRCIHGQTPVPTPAILGAITLDSATSAHPHGHAELTIDGHAATLMF